MKTTIKFYVQVYPGLTQKTIQSGFFVHNELPVRDDYNKDSTFYEVELPVETTEVQAIKVDPVSVKKV